MDVKVKLVFWVLFVFAEVGFGGAVRRSSARRNLEAKRHLSRLNKPSVKSIKVGSILHVWILVSYCFLCVWKS